jgi:hypothetical protein
VGTILLSQQRFADHGRSVVLVSEKDGWLNLEDFVPEVFSNFAVAVSAQLLQIELHRRPCVIAVTAQLECLLIIPRKVVTDRTASRPMPRALSNS